MCCWGFFSQGFTGMAQLEKQVKASQKFLLGLLGLPNFVSVREEIPPACGTEKAVEI